MNYFTFTDGIIKYNDIRPIYAGSEQCTNLHSFGPVLRHHAVIFFCKSGKGVYSVDDRVYEIKEGQIFIQNSGDVVFHQADEFDPWHYIWIALSGTVTERLSKLPTVIDLECSKVFDDIHDLVVKGEMKPEKYLICLIKLFEELFPDPENAATDFAIRAKEYINLHYMENISVEKISESFGMDRRYLLRIFKHRFGVTIVDYLIKVRMESAANFLKQRYSVGKTAAMCGYPDPYSFSKMFKKYHGISPAYYAQKE